LSGRSADRFLMRKRDLAKRAGPLLGLTAQEFLALRKNN
jgi:hypothetical protein